MKKQRQHVSRNSRLESDPSRYSCKVSFAQSTSHPQWAQFADISESGMKLISTKAQRLSVGEIVEVKFSLAGGTHEVSTLAKVVRKANEYVFGIQFLSDSAQIRSAFWHHVRYVKSLTFTQPLTKISRWFGEHKLGLGLAFIAAVAFVFAIGGIYSISDEAAGKKQAWSSAYMSRLEDQSFYRK